METGTEEYTVGKLTADTRTRTGKGVARKLRVDGKIPAVVYGKGTQSVALTVDPVALKRALDPGKRQNTVIDLTILDQGQSREVKVMLKDYQIDTLKQVVLHADFIQISMDQEIEVSVPLLLEGKPEGVKFGGTLHQVFRELQLRCKPADIPAAITYDVTAMQINDTLRAKDLALQGAKISLPENLTIALVMAAKAVVEETTTVAEEAVVEGAAKEGEPAKDAKPAKDVKKD